MHAQLGRRVFIGSVAAGLPMLTVATPLAQTRGGAKGNSAPDPVFEHALDELGRIHTRGRARKAFTGEDARAAAAQLRGIAVYARQTDVDGRMKKALRDQVNKRGRDSLFDQPADHAKGHAELKRHGIEAEARPSAVPLPDYVAQTRELDELLKNGPTAMLDRTAALLERLSAALDQQASTQGPALRHVGQTWYNGFCQQLSVEIARLQIEAALAQLAAQALPDLYAVYLMILAAAGVQSAIFVATCGWGW